MCEKHCFLSTQENPGSVNNQVGLFASGKDSAPMIRKPVEFEVRFIFVLVELCSQNSRKAPPLPSSFPELDFKSADELQRMLNDESELWLALEDVAVFKGLSQLRDQAREANVREKRKPVVHYSPMIPS